MKVQTTFEKCCICGNYELLTNEHIIPESIGGTLECNIQCSTCNNNLGSELISQFKTDPAMRLAVQNLRNDLPELFQSFERKQRFVATDSSGQAVIVTRQNSENRIRAERRDDGSFVFDPVKDESNIRSLLRGRVWTDERIQAFFQEFPRDDSYIFIDFAKEPIISHIKIESYFPELNSPEIDDRAIVLIAYNYLCLLFGNLVLDENLNFIRKYIRNGENCDRIEIQSLISLEYKPYHAIFSEVNQQDSLISVILFGWVKYVVKLKNMIYRGPDIVFVQDLKDKRILVAKSMDEANKGNYYTNK